MSKGNMFLGFARGKVGSVVFSRANGQQITRAKSDVVANPQTEAQMIQRIFLNTVAQAYSNMGAIVDHSFEGLQKGQQCMSYFMKTNMKAIRQRVAQAIADGYTMEEIFEFSPIGSNFFAPNAYLISKGKLPAIAVVDAAADAEMKFALNANTYQGIIDQYGLQRGDQLTFCLLVSDGNGNQSFKFARVILDPKENDGTDAPLSTAFVADGAFVKPNQLNEGALGAISYGTGYVTFGEASGWLRAAAVIVSRKGEGDVWQRSTTYLAMNESSADVMYSLQYCLDLFASGGITTENPRYLNNANNGGGMPATPQPVTPLTITKVSKNGTNFVAVPANFEQITKVQFTGTLTAEDVLKRYDGTTLEGTYTIAEDGSVNMEGTIVDENPIYIRHYRGETLVATISTANP